MPAQGRIKAIGRSVATLLAALAISMPAPGSPPELLPAESAEPVFDPMCAEVMRADARLAEVAFVDRRCGWAVGDRGTIWHTDDGGRHWQLQPSGVWCRLESVCFIDEKTGWAAGGGSHPYSHSSTGVVLVTHDGGRSWRRTPNQLLPALKQIRFFDSRHGWAVGCWSAMFPSGVFFTDDGGLGWKPLPGTKTAGWVAGDFLAPYEGILADQRGTPQAVRRGSVEPAATGRFGLRALERMRLVRDVQPQLFGWAAGQGGLLMVTADLGASWQTPHGELPEGIAQFDFAALAVRGEKIWVAGSPGTRVIHSPDAGRSWQAFSTGQSLPIRGLSFVDEQYGWAVGELGTILATTDGGQSWERQRSGGTRAALLGLFAEPKDVPLELFARLSGNDGYLGVVETLGRRDWETAPRAPVGRADRLHEALVGVGASGGRTAWRFPLRQEGLALDARQIVDGWDRANDGRGMSEMEAHLVRQIRLWRPAVVVTHDAGARGDDPLGGLVHRVVLEAVRRASDPTSYPEQITRAGLDPWEVKKVYAVLGSGAHGATGLSTAELAERLGRSLADVAAGPRSLLDDQFHAPPESFSFRLLVDKLSPPPDRPDFFAGIVLYPGGEARRELIEPTVATLDAIRRVAQRRRNMRTIIERSRDDPQGGVGLLGQAGDLTRDLDPDGSARILYHLANRYFESGKWALAAEAFELVAERHPEHPLSRAALSWLVQYYASGEAAWRVHGNQRFVVQQAAAVTSGEGARRLEVQQASRPAIDSGTQEDRAARSAALGEQIQRTRPDLFAEPSIRFPLSVVDRRRGFPGEAERFYLIQSGMQTDDAWSACARGEQWLADPKGAAPKPVLECVRASRKPLLDGRLDDALWQQAQAATLRNPQGGDADWPATVKLAYDAQFLYLAICARQAPGADYRAGEGPRPRDPDLSAHDRVDLLLDLDRDFVTYDRLTVDHRGWPREECWGDSTWNPTWFVAAATDAGTWAAEAAVPLDQLTGSYPAPRTVWAIGIQRTVPGVGFQSWSTPAAVAVIPEGFGYLIFR